MKLKKTRPVFSKRKSFASLGSSDIDVAIDSLKSIVHDKAYLEASIILSSEGGKGRQLEMVVEPSEFMRKFYEDYKQVYQNKGVRKYFSMAYWKSREHMELHREQAKSVTVTYASNVSAVLTPVFDANDVQTIASNVAAGCQDLQELDRLAKLLKAHYFEIKSYDDNMRLLSTEARAAIDLMLECEKSGGDIGLFEWKETFKSSVFRLWASELENIHSEAIVWLRSGNIDVLYEEYSKALESKRVYCRNRLLGKAFNSGLSEEIEFFSRCIGADVSNTKSPLTIRKLNEKYMDDPNYKALLPVWMASPESVSNVFPLVQGLFDVVIFDEASQCTVEEALPAIFRGKKIIVAGDDKQLPPSDLLKSRIDWNHDEVEGHELALEPSLLSMAKRNTTYKRFMLDWHYRSKHEELISFSNVVFYDGKIKFAPNIIPFREGNETAIDWFSVEGYWEDQSNRQEAEKVVERLKYHLKENPHLSLGVITFNKKQKDLIQALIEDEAVKDVQFAVLLGNDGRKAIDEQYFVKNIENVQGDERDIIIFSIAYAPMEPQGRVALNFGVFNGHGGENRLNVAITRAARRCEIISSIDPDRDLDTSTSKHNGPKILKNYLRYAQAVAKQDFGKVRAILGEYAVRIREPGTIRALVLESPFEAEVFEALTRMGYQVHTQIGQSGYRIDMAVVHPEDNGRYVLAIECDGARYHSNCSAREHDKYRQDFLSSKGWRIHRIWSTNWWYDKDKELEKVRSAIEMAMRNDSRSLLS